MTLLDVERLNEIYGKHAEKKVYFDQAFPFLF